ncbi:hypothetical protein NDU88_008617 [Pleurodeles waltl]|uniref:Uncharacterized protein n=1 Tax=Pleurodeles waltl TaxID=8319 RepID=A0AAV7RTL6_PLEWA|nr:hypothetical protein NDU88_008617 [Pleurodeles waltl]
MLVLRRSPLGEPGCVVPVRCVVIFLPGCRLEQEQAQSKPLESTSQKSQGAARQQGNSKAAVLFSKAVKRVL